MFLISTVVFALLAQLALAQDCSDTSLRQCEAAFNGVIFPNNFTFDDALPLWNDTTSICLAINAFSTCINTVTPYCPLDLQLSFQGETASYSFLCQNTTEFQSYKTCFAIKAAQTNKILCRNILNAKLNKLQNISDAQTKYSAECQYYNDYSDCITNSITRLCGADASYWLNIFLSYLYTPLMTNLGCQGYGTPDPGSISSDNSVWTVILGVVLGISALILVGGVIILLALVGRKRKQRNRLHRRTGTGSSLGNGENGSSQALPPPYMGPFVIYERPGADGQPQIRLVDSQEILPASAGPSIIGLQPNSGLDYKSPILPPPYSLLASSTVTENQLTENIVQAGESGDQSIEAGDQRTNTGNDFTETANQPTSCSLEANDCSNRLRDSGDMSTV